MTPLELWRYKVLQTWHDPIHKMAVQQLVAHESAALRHLAVLTGVDPKRLPFKAPDRLATGADRPVVGGRGDCLVSWRTSPVLTHPLQPLRLAVEWDALPAGKGATAAAGNLDAALLDLVRPLALPAGGWDSADEVRRLLFRLWRLAPELARGLGLQAAYLPADSRCPDHSTWDHTRVASAAAYLVEMKTKTRPPEREPWMLAFTLGGVQRFLDETRKARDLWTASMIFADLAWAAMRPIVEELGPDAVLYPDLRGNPAADRWLLERALDAVPEPVRRSQATSHAATLPNTFVALVPRGGGDSGLPELVELARACADSVGARWRELAGAVEGWLVKRFGRGPWEQIWRRQVDGRLGEPPVAWAAVPWPRRMDEAGEPTRGAALPGQSPDAPVSRPPEQLERRRQELSPWLPDRIWSHYELARDVFWHSHAGFLTAERGFDYSLVHHQLRAALALRKAAGTPRVFEEPGEKCSLTGREEVLHNGEAGSGPLVERRREGARQLWSKLDAEGLGSERLGSTAAIKRYLVHAEEPGFAATWESSAEARERGGGNARVPFPSTAAIAAASFLEGLADRAAEPAIAAAIRAYLAAFERSGLGETVDPRALPALARAARGPGMERLLAIEPEYLFPETLEILVRSAPEPQRGGREAFRDASEELRDAAANRGLRPRKLVAVLRMDGDALARLILGDPRVIPTRWRDVLHPKAVVKVVEKLTAAGWPGLLGERRLMGPALHAAITRSLADFAHRMAAWVVEWEFNGRLVYAGGDDLLALLPAVEAIPAAARLQQLFSAPYVLDTDADADPWSWRRGEPPGGTAAARQRFRVPAAGDGPGEPPTIRLSERRFEPHADGDPASVELPEDKAVGLYPMLGRGQSLSAGVVIGHFKSPLGLMLRTSRELLERDAKELMGRGALAVTLLSRGGTKVTFAGRWRTAGVAVASGEEGDGRAEESGAVNPDPPDLQRHLSRVVGGFARPEPPPTGTEPAHRPRLAGRVPYKLRDRIEATGRVLLDPRTDRGKLVRRLVEMESGLSAKRAGDQELLDSVARLVECGLGYAERLSESAAPPAGRFAQNAVAGLLLARKLAADGSANGTP